MMSLSHIAKALGGVVTSGQVMAPGPGHRPHDRSMAVKIGEGGNLLVHSHAGDDAMRCKAYVEQRLGIVWQPSDIEANGAAKAIDRMQARAKKANGHVTGDGPSQPIDNRQASALKLWGEAVDPRGTIVEAYLASRRLDLPEGVAMTTLRFHPSCPFGPGVRLPCMVAAMRSIETGAVVAIHRTALTEDGRKIDRKMLGPADGAVIMLGELDAERGALTIGEGIESALSGLAMGFAPAWAMGSAGAIGKLPVLHGVDSLTILGEHDGGASAKAIRQVGSNWREAEREVYIATPKPDMGKDANDAWQARESEDTDVLDVQDFASAFLGEHGWQPPRAIVSSLPKVASFTPTLLPKALRQYVYDVSDRQQSPVDFVAVAALCGLAAVVGNKVRVQPKSLDNWTIVPNLWGAVIGPPSAMKSPAMDSALAPAFMIQDEMRALWQEQCAQFADDEMLADLEAKTAKANAAKLLKAGDRDGALKLLKGKQGEDAPPEPRLIVNDATVEKLGELLNENRNGLLLIRDELPGFLSRMEDQDCQAERAFYLEAFNGTSSFTFDRIGRGTIRIECSTVSIIGGVQPSRIIPLVRGAVSGASNDGLLQRLQMTVWPDPVASWKWVDRSPDAFARAAVDRIFRDLRDIPLMPDGGHRVMRFTPAAQSAFREWMELIQLEARSKTLPSALESHILKMPKTVASLALIFDLIEGDGDDLIEEAALRRALGWADYLRTHANRLYAAGQAMAEEGARLIVERRSQLPEQFTARDVHRKQWTGLTDRDAVASAVEMLVETCHCRQLEISHPGAGRPTSAYEWNPALVGRKAGG